MQRCKNNVDGVCQLEGELCPGDRPCAEWVEDDGIIPPNSHRPPSGIGMQYLQLGILGGSFDLEEKLWFAAMHNELIGECHQAVV